MKPLKPILLYSLTALLFFSCTNHPAETEFQSLIVESKQYPIAKDTEIFLSNSYMVAEFKKHRLDELAYVKLDDSRRKRGESYRPYIRFTEKARPYLLGEAYFSKEGPSAYAQKVATYSIDFKGISRIKFNRDKTRAIVLYEEEYRNVSPFANLYVENVREQIAEGGINLQEVYFFKDQEGWHLQANPDQEFISVFMASFADL